MVIAAQLVPQIQVALLISSIYACIIKKAERLGFIIFPPLLSSKNQD